jgi:hypothetical protein
MAQNKRRVHFPPVTITLLLVLLLASFSNSRISARDFPASQNSSEETFLPLEMNRMSSDTNLFLPLLRSKFPFQTAFGIAVEQINASGGLDALVSANAFWTRPVGITWSAIEPSEGNYDWSVLSKLEEELRNASDAGIQVILIVHGTPEWARKNPGTGSTCGPIAAEKLNAFGDFMVALVSRYGPTPYQVKYWEIWNEPDIDPSIVPVDNPYGCWGDPSDEYFGGEYYSEMLTAIYPRIKSADPQSQVIVGGLLLDCDPRGGCAAEGKSNLPSKFLEGVLKDSLGSNFDGISFHAYDYYAGELGKYNNPSWMSAWDNTGPVGIAKAGYIRSLLDQYGISGKYLINTESALVCGFTGMEPVCQTTDFGSSKAYYVAQSFATAIAQGFRANLWYNIYGWRGSGLVDQNNNPLPAFEAFRFSRNELGDGVFNGIVTPADLGGVVGVTGYKIQRGSRLIWVLWSLDGNAHRVTLSGLPDAAWGALGEPLLPALEMEVSLEPFYLEWIP